MDNSSKDVTVIDDGVEVQRTIEDRETSTVVVYRLLTLASTARVVQLEESVPPEDRIETLEFHPDHLPNDWTKRDGTLQFAVTVPPNETRMVVLGIEAADETPIGREEPQICHLELEGDAPGEPDGSASLDPGSDADPPEKDRSNVLDRDAERVTDGGDAATGSTEDEVLDLADPNADEPIRTDEETEQSSGTNDTEASATGIDTDPSSADPDEVTDIEGSTEEFGADDVAAANLGLDDDAARELGFDDEPDVEPAATADGGSLVGDLVGDIQAGNVDEAELDALRSELGVARTDEVRIQHVQSRMSDFEAYVDALEEVINSHGTATEFVDSIERSVTDLEAELGMIREEVSTVENGLETADDEREQLTEEIAALEETVAGFGDELAMLQDLVETVDERTTTLETELRAEIEALRDEREEQFDRIESELDAVREELEADVESELDSLREDVESFNELRRTLLDAFGNGLDITPPEDTAAR